MMLPPKVSRSTIAAHRRGSVNVLVHPEKDSLDAMATLFFSSRSVRTWKRSSAPRRSSAVPGHSSAVHQDLDDRDYKPSDHTVG